MVWQTNDKLRLMGGFGIDEGPADSDKIGFELPTGESLYILALV